MPLRGWSEEREREREELLGCVVGMDYSRERERVIWEGDEEVRERFFEGD